MYFYINLSLIPYFSWFITLLLFLGQFSNERRRCSELEDFTRGLQSDKQLAQLALADAEGHALELEVYENVLGFCLFILLISCVLQRSIKRVK